MARLTDCRNPSATRAHVTVALTVNLQYALSGTEADEAPPALTRKFKIDMAKLCDLLLMEAEEIADVAEETARAYDVVPEGEDPVGHHDCGNPTIDSRGSKAYLRVEITSTRKIPHSRLMELVEALLACFREYVFEQVKAVENGAALVVDRRAGILGAQAVLAALSGSDEPQPGEHA